MDDLAKRDAWKATLKMLCSVSAPATSRHARPAMLRRERETISTADATAETVAVAPPTVKILERRTPTSVSIGWCDSTSCRYGDQIWTMGIARRPAVCALSGAQIMRGDAVYRPRQTRGNVPVNADQLILASAMP